MSEIQKPEVLGLRRTWRNAGAPVDGIAGTLAGISDPGDLLIDTTNKKLYQNRNTKASPAWVEIAASSIDYAEVGDMADPSTGMANDAGISSEVSRGDHVHKLGDHDHSAATKGGQIGSTAFAADAFTADEAGRAPFQDGFANAAKLASDSVPTIKIVDLNVTTGKLANGVLSANADGRAKMAANFFDADTAAAKIAESAIPASKVNLSAGVIPTTILPDASAAEGVSGNVARADHTHGITCATPSGAHVPDSADAEGAASTFTRADHVHALPCAAAEELGDVAGSEGTNPTFARSDHTHAAFDVTAPVNQAIGDAAAVGAAVVAARRDHGHGMPAFAIPTGVHAPDCADAEGSAVTLPRTDHVHALPCDIAIDITGTPGEGNSSSFARANHDHGIAAGVVNSAALDKGHIYCQAFQYTNVVANLNLQKMKVVQPDTLEICIPVAGSIIGMSIRANAAREAGTLIAEVYVGDAATGFTVTLDDTNTQKHYANQAKDLDALAAGDLLNVRITSHADWLPVTADIVVVVWCEMD